MRINYNLNEDNTIKNWVSYPLDETKPIIEVHDPRSIDLNKDMVINGEFVEWAGKLESKQKLVRIMELRRLLVETDYLCLKHADGALTDEEYAETRAQRQAWRDEINELEA